MKKRDFTDYTWTLEVNADGEPCLLVSIGIDDPAEILHIRRLDGRVERLYTTTEERCRLDLDIDEHGFIRDAEEKQ